MTENDRYTIISLLETGLTVKEIQEKTNDAYSYLSISNLKNKYEKSIEEDAFANLVDIEKYTAFKYQLEAKSSPEFVKEFEKLGSKLKGLELLKENVQETANRIVNQVNGFLHAERTVQELKLATDIITNIHNAMLKESNTQVNVQNNFVQEGTEKYKNLLSDNVISYEKKEPTDNK